MSYIVYPPVATANVFIPQVTTYASSQTPPTQGILLPSNPISYYAQPAPPPPPPPIILGVPVQTTTAVTAAVCFPPPPPPPLAPPVVVAGMPWPVRGLPLRVAP